jgi:hypothetical protein
MMPASLFVRDTRNGLTAVPLFVSCARDLIVAAYPAGLDRMLP